VPRAVRVLPCCLPSLSAPLLVAPLPFCEAVPRRIRARRLVTMDQPP